MDRTSDPAPSIVDFLQVPDYLSAWFAWKKRTSPRFSHRAFAKRMGQSSPSIGADLIAGRRRLTQALLAPLAAARATPPA